MHRTVYNQGGKKGGKEEEEKEEEKERKINPHLALRACLSGSVSRDCLRFRVKSVGFRNWG